MSGCEMAWKMFRSESLKIRSDSPLRKTLRSWHRNAKEHERHHEGHSLHGPGAGLAPRGLAFVKTLEMPPHAGRCGWRPTLPAQPPCRRPAVLSSSLQTKGEGAPYWTAAAFTASRSFLLTSAASEAPSMPRRLVFLVTCAPTSPTMSFGLSSSRPWCP